MLIIQTLVLYWYVVGTVHQTLAVPSWWACFGLVNHATVRLLVCSACGGTLCCLSKTAGLLSAPVARTAPVISMWLAWANEMWWEWRLWPVGQATGSSLSLAVNNFAGVEASSQREHQVLNHQEPVVNVLWEHKASLPVKPLQCRVCVSCQLSLVYSS